MPELTLGEAAAAVSGSLDGQEGVTTAGYSIDSRSLAPGDLFFALVGPNHDGHDFVEAAVAAGACGVVVSADVSAERPGAKDAAVLRVADTTRALQDLAVHVRKREAVQVVGITGSAGKTTTKEMTFRLLDGKFKAYRSEGNYNNLYGLPLALLRMPAGTQVAVLEMGMSTPGELRQLTALASPEVGVLTNVGMAHRANFSDITAIAAAKEELFQEMGAHGTGIFNFDDERCRAIADRFGGFTFTFGMQQAADLSASQVQVEDLRGTRLEVQHGDSRWPVRIALAGVHQAYNLLAALSVGYMLGCDLDWMTEKAAELEPLAGRGAVLDLPGGGQLFDDSYNSNPAALRQAIATLVAAAPPGSRRVLITGDMLELGDEAMKAHQEAGRLAAESGIEAILAVGTWSKETVRSAEEAGIATAIHCADSEEAAEAARALVQPGDTVLVKGSRGMKMERVVQRLQGVTGNVSEERRLERE